ncbi:hypothetical protein HALO32_00008 [Halomonas lysinitropha]|uniref:Uncharacterized protein n=1 Tax=Halomonas lysinitropha TaxID=2607506 RepID=A0A5K1I0S8_9GAMM|nr:hypothetical protein HALO32_00008 [Halomonas lysinitropha]
MADHLDPRRHDMQFLADFLADDLELGTVVVTVMRLVRQFMNDLDSRQLGGQSNATTAGAALGRLTRLGSRLVGGRVILGLGVLLIDGHFGLVDEQVALCDAVLLGGRAELALSRQAELLEQRRLGGFPLGLFLLHQLMEARDLLLLSTHLVLQLGDGSGGGRGR